MLHPGHIALAADLALFGSSAAAAPAPPAQLLTAGASLEQKLASGEVHAYEIEVPAGLFLGIRVEQRGIDVVIRILDPAGTVLRRHDSPTGDIDIESVSFVAGRVARYRIEVSSFDPRAFPGRYLLTLDGPRARHRVDEARIVAEQELEKAAVLFDEGTASSFAAANSRYAEAARRFAPIDPRQESIALAGVAETERRLGRTEQAVRSAQQALEVARKIGDHAGESLLLESIGYVQFFIEGRPEGLESLRQAIALESSPRARSEQYSNLAFFHWLLGQYDDAIAENQRTLELARAAGSRQAEALALKNLAQVYASLGFPGRALDYADEALRVIRGVPEGLPIEAHILTARGRIWRTLDDPGRCLADLQAALALRRRIGDRQGEGTALIEIAQIRYDLGDRPKARDSVESALGLSASSQDSRARARELVLLGRIEQADGRLPEAGRAWDEALALSRSIADRSTESSVLFAMARAARARGDLENALRSVERGLDLVESLRAEVPLPELRASYGASTESDRQLLTEILIALDRKTPGKGFAQRAFGATERARARTLTEAIADGNLATGEEIPAALRARQRDASARIAFLQRRIADAPASGRSRWIAELARAEEDFDRVVLEARRTSPRLAALRYPTPLTAEQARADLAAGEAMVSYALVGERLFAFVLTPSGLTLVGLPADVPRLQGRVENFVELLSRDDPTRRHLADRLSTDLIEPLRAALAPSIRRLVIVPDGPLNALPFEALPSRPGERRALLEDFTISYAPSATVLAAVSSATPWPDARREDLIAFADPDLPAPSAMPERAALRPGGSPGAMTLARIPGARLEAEAIVRYASSGSKIYSGAEASEALVKREQLYRYRVLHFATHGHVNLENPGRSALLLATSPGDGEDGLLQAREISGLRLHSDLVVLSGCETARGKILSGEGVQSLARAFFLAGARSVVASLWKVRDQATEELMSAFYRNLAAGQSKDEALRAAKLEISSHPATASPRDWASFVLIGEASGKIPLTARR